MLHSERTKLYGDLVFLSPRGLKTQGSVSDPIQNSFFDIGILFHLEFLCDLGYILLKNLLHAKKNDILASPCS